MFCACKHKAIKNLVRSAVLDIVAFILNSTHVYCIPDQYRASSVIEDQTVWDLLNLCFYFAFHLLTLWWWTKSEIYQGWNKHSAKRIKSTTEKVIFTTVWQSKFHVKLIFKYNRSWPVTLLLAKTLFKFIYS